MVGELKYTAHAFERMTERDITRPMVEAVVRCGDLVKVDPGGQARYAMEGLFVVLDGCDVVTVFYDDDTRQRGKWSAKKRQRRSGKWEFKPIYFSGRGKKVNVRQQEYYLRRMEGGR